MSRKLRLGIPQIGGTDWRGGFNYLVNLCSVLVQHGRGRVAPVVFVKSDLAAHDDARLRTIPGVTVVDGAPFMIGKGRGRRLVDALLTGSDRTAAQAFAAQAIDVVFENAAFFGARLPLPTLSWIPDFRHRHMPQLFNRRDYWHREIGFRTLMAARRPIMLSSGDAHRDLTRFYGDASVHIARFAVAPSAPSERASAARVAERHELPERYLFLPNQFWRHKNHVVVIEALNILRQQGEDVVVAVVGHGDDPRAPGHYAQLAARVDALDLGAHFRLLGLVPYGEVRALMLAAAALINPSRFEGWSTTVEEAKAFGTPMLLSDLPVHREQAGDAARYFGCDDPHALAAAMRDAMLAARAPYDEAAAWKRVSTFAYEVEDIVAATHDNFMCR